MIIHSPVVCGNKYHYIPHPLYIYPIKSTEDSACSFSNDNYYIFGRVVKYKKYEDVISAFPANKNLIIMGSCEDDEYKIMIQELCKNRKMLLLCLNIFQTKKQRNYFLQVLL